MASLVTEGVLPLQVALVHLVYNVSGVLVFYPIPQTRIPVFTAKFFGRLTRIWRGFPIIYISVFFVTIPLVVLGITACFTANGTGYTLLGIFFTCVVVIWTVWTAFHCKYRGGWEKMIACFQRREKTRRMYDELPTDLDYIKEKLSLLLEETGLEERKFEPEDADTNDSDDLKKKHGGPDGTEVDC
jgi:solute carrier family 34 (sodium-dependent phosphate cotransporter)